MNHEWRGRMTVGALAFLATSMLGCGDKTLDSIPAVEEPTNLIWIVVDTLRADALSCYGGPVETPNIDELANRGTRYEWAFSHYPMTAPSHLSMFTGLLPEQHGVTDNTLVVNPEFDLIAERMSNAGFATGAVVSLGVLREKFGFSQGFDEYDAIFNRQWFRPGSDVTGSAVDIAADLKDRGRFFLFVHYSDPHEPYTPPGLDYPEIAIELNGEEIATISANGLAEPIDLVLLPGDNEVTLNPVGASGDRRFIVQQLAHGPGFAKPFAGAGWDLTAGDPIAGGVKSSLPASVRFVSSASEPKRYPLKVFVFEDLDVHEVRERYLREVQFVDSEIGRLLRELDRLEVLDDSMVILTADHGEGIGDHDLIGHVHQVYNSLIRVPLILHGPGVRASSVERSFVFHADLIPTLEAAFQLPSAPALTGRNLLAPQPLDSVPSMGPNRAMTASPPSTDNLACVLSDPWKLIVNWDSGVRELYELRNDPDELAVVVDDNLEERLSRGLVRWQPEAGPATEAAVLSEEEIENLRALGYVNR